LGRLRQEACGRPRKTESDFLSEIFWPLFSEEREAIFFILSRNLQLICFHEVIKFWSVMNVTRLLRISLGLFCVSLIVAGCSSVKVPQWSGSGFLKKEFLEYKRVAVLPFKGDTEGKASDAFAQSFHERFDQMTLVVRKQLLGSFWERDLYSDRLNKATERKIAEDFGVQALVIGDVYYPSVLRWLLQVQIVDVETNEVLGRSLVEIDFMGALGVKQACKIAVQNLVPN